MSESVAVIGAGLVGCLSAIALAKRGYRVTVFDYRKDPRDKSTTERNLRSINLAISSRGISSLEFIDKEMAERVLKDIIPMRGRMIHHLDGKQESQIYGLFGETINSIDRAVLNNYLLDELDRFDNDTVQLKFGHKLAKIKFRDSEEFQSCIFTTDEGVDRVYGVNFIVGCDGSYSTTRDQMQREVRMRYSQEYIDCCYIELYIPPSEAYVEEFKGNFSIAPDHLHIWPRHKFMLIALANKDGSFTSTFFGPWKLVESLLQSKSAVKAFLEDNFPDAMDIMGLENAVECFMKYPKGALMCVECEPYHVPGGRCIILGDAAHSMVPFYGQGMNCGFEDVKVLMKLLDSNHGDRTKAFDAYTERRHRDLTAIIRLAIRNYTEMSHDVTSVSFLLKKKIDGLLGRIFKDRWLPLYTMVSFRADIPYHKAVAIAKRQDKILGFIQAILIASISVVGYKAFRVFYSRIRRLKR